MKETANTFELESKLLIADTKTISTLFAQENGSDAVALYFFYYNTAKRQDTDQVRATELFTRTGLRWGVKRFREAYAVLEQFGLVEIIKSSAKWYIKINYVKKSNSAKNSLVESEPNSAKKQLVASGTQMLSNNINLNAYTSTNVEGRVLAKTSSCPLMVKIKEKGFDLNKHPWFVPTPLQEKYPGGHKECVEYLTSEEAARGQKFINRGKQFNFVHKILRAGYDFTAMDKTIRVMEKKYGKGGWDFGTMSSFLEKGSANAK